MSIEVIDCSNNAGLTFAAIPVTDPSDAVSSPWLFDVNTVSATDSKFKIHWTKNSICGALTWTLVATFDSDGTNASSYMTLTHGTSSSELAIDLSSRISTAPEETITIVLSMQYMDHYTPGPVTTIWSFTEIVCNNAFQTNAQLSDVILLMDDTKTKTVALPDNHNISSQCTPTTLTANSGAIDSKTSNWLNL